MLKHQIESMRRTATKMSLRPIPPAHVLIEQPHAEHLGVKFQAPKIDVDAPTRQAPPPGTRTVPPLVEVRFEDFYKGLKGAKGIDEDEPDTDADGDDTNDAGT